MLHKFTGVLSVCLERSAFGSYQNRFVYRDITMCTASTQYFGQGTRITVVGKKDANSDGCRVDSEFTRPGSQLMHCMDICCMQCLVKLVTHNTKKMPKLMFLVSRADGLSKTAAVGH